MATLPSYGQYRQHLGEAEYLRARGATWHRISGSTNVAQIAWWIDASRDDLPILAVTFTPKRGHRPRYRVWWYEGVPRRVYLAMLRASSRGRFVWTDLYPEYHGYEVTEAPNGQES